MRVPFVATLLLSLLSFPSLAQPPSDEDKDGISQDADQCPQSPEDLDGFADSDGCPDPDNDGDGILDIDDKCPNEPEIFNEFEDEDGCPEKIEIKTIVDPIVVRVLFASKSARISAEAIAILKEVAAALKKHPEIKRLRVEGHSDSQGSQKQLQKISEKRAQVVTDFLIAQGVDPARLFPVGYADKCPIADNKTREGREKNRRIDFIILEDGKDPLSPCGG